MPTKVTGALVSQEPVWHDLTFKKPAEILPIGEKTEPTGEKAKPPEEKSPITDYTPAPIPKSLKHIADREPKFFSEPKKVVKKTEGSIISFQLFTSLLFCLILFLSRIAVPQLYENIHIFLTRLFS